MSAELGELVLHDPRRKAAFEQFELAAEYEKRGNAGSPATFYPPM